MSVLYLLIVACGCALFGIGTALLWSRVNLGWLTSVAYLIVISVPFERLPSLAIAGVSVRISQILVLLGLYCLAILILKRDQQLLQLKISPLLNWIVGFWVALIPSLFVAINSSRQLQILIATGLAYGATFLVANFTSNFTRAVRHLCFVLAGVSVFGLYQFVGDFVGIPYTWTLLREHYTKQVFGFARIQATALEPLYWGGMLLLPCIYFLLQIIAYSKQAKVAWKSIAWNGLGLGLVYLNMILTLSRGAYLALLVTLVTGLVLILKDLNWRNIKLVFAPFICLVIFLGGGFMATGNYNQLLAKGTDHVLNVFDSRQFSTYERLNFLDQAFKLLPDNAIFGIGSGNYGPRSQNNIPQKDGGWLIVNNVYLEIWLEQGLTALIVFLTMFGWYLISGIRRLNQIARKLTLTQRITLVSVIAALSGYLAQWTTFSPIFIMPIFVLLGLLVNFLDQTPTPELDK